MSLPAGRSSPRRAPEGGDAALWSELLGATSPEGHAQAWLALQCRGLGRVQLGAVLLGPAERGPYTPVAFWPDRRLEAKSLEKAAQRALQERRGVVLPAERLPGRSALAPPVQQIGYPLLLDQRVHGVVVLAVEPRAEADLAIAMRQLQWGMAWLEIGLRRERAERDRALIERQCAALDLIASLLDAERSFAALSGFASELATRLGCERVSIGLLERGRLRASVLSHSADFGERSNWIRALESAMEEALDQQQPLVFPALPGSALQITRAHAELARLHGAGAIVSLPLARGARAIGVLTLERGAEQPIDEPTLELCAAVAALVGPLIEIARRDERSLASRFAERARERLRELLGPGRVALKLGSALALLTALALAGVRWDYRVAADAVLEPVVRRVAAAPYDGYVARSGVRPGDRVAQGQLLVALDDRELRLEQQRIDAELGRAEREYRRALASRDAAEVEIQGALVAQSRARLELIQDQLARAEIRAPFESIVLSGDLTQALGAPVARGDVLFELAPLDGYRVVLQVDDRDIPQLAPEQPGSLLLSAFPNQPLDFVVQTVTPVSEPKEGHNAFEVEARISDTGAAARLRPGMQGVGKVNVGRRNLFWIWTHPLWNRMRLLLWRWLP